MFPGAHSPRPAVAVPSHFPDEHREMELHRGIAVPMPPMSSPQAVAMGHHSMHMRAKMLSVLVAFVGFLTLISFWAVFYWPIVLCMLMIYLATASYRIAMTHGASHYLFSHMSRVFAGKEITLILFAVAMLGSFAEVVVGIVLAIITDSPTYVVFQGISAATGVVSLFSLFFLQVTLRYLDRPILVGGTGPASPGAGGEMWSGGASPHRVPPSLVPIRLPPPRYPQEALYTQSPFPQPVQDYQMRSPHQPDFIPSTHLPPPQYSRDVSGRRSPDAFRRDMVQQPRLPSPTDRRDNGQSRSSPNRRSHHHHHTYHNLPVVSHPASNVNSVASVIPPEGMREIAELYRTSPPPPPSQRMSLPFGSPSPRLPNDVPYESSSLHAERNSAGRSWGPH